MYAEYATKDWEGGKGKVGRVKKVVLQRCDTESITLEGDDGEMGGSGKDGEGRRESKETCAQ